MVQTKNLKMKVIYETYRRHRNNSSNKNNNGHHGIEIGPPIPDYNTLSNHHHNGASVLDSNSDSKLVVGPGRHIISIESLVINKELGIGEFGVVQQGVWTNPERRRIQVAIKCLSSVKLENNRNEFLKEASIMYSISHEHIVTLYGVVLDPSVMLVTELAPLRSLLECLKEPALISHFPLTSLCTFAVQVADGMAYLESKRFIHRDLAARNILVFSKNKVKISDFGLSRALGVGKDYYQSNFNVNLKLPIAWCAPECINYLKFTSQSDVWAYGVTLWEMFSFGFQPWAALTGQQILEAIDKPNYQRLERPECCPKEYYQLMLKCWTHDPLMRPKFSEILLCLPDCKPELLQAHRDFENSLNRKDYLAYKINDIVTVIDKSQMDEGFWKGVTNDRRTGLFNPSDFVAYLGQNLPSLNNPNSNYTPTNSFVQQFLSGNSNGSSHSNHLSSSLASTITSTVLQSSKFIRGFLESKSNQNHQSSPQCTRKNSRLRPEMISRPQGDLKHTGHVGADGIFFGDVSFLDSKYQSVPQKISHNYNNLDNDCKTSKKLTTTNNNLHTEKRISDYLNDVNHKYHEISDDDEQIGPLESPSFEVFDFGPSLMEEVFRELDHIKPDLNNDAAESETAINENSINVKNEVRELNFKMTKEANNIKKKQMFVKPISEADMNELDSAIEMAKDIAKRSMFDDDVLDLNKNNCSPKTPNSPNKRKFSFKFPSHKFSPKSERKTFSEETESIGNIIESITPAAKEAYLTLVEKGLSTSNNHKKDLQENKKESRPPSPLSSNSTFINSSIMNNNQQLPNSNEVENNPLRMLRTAGIGSVLRPKARGNRSFSQPRLPTTAQTAGLARVASSRSQLGSPPLAPAVSTELDGQTPPLPPRDRSRPLIQLKTHQRRHPLIIPAVLTNSNSAHGAPTFEVGQLNGQHNSNVGEEFVRLESATNSNGRFLDSPPLVQNRHVISVSTKLKHVSCPQAPANFLSFYSNNNNNQTNKTNITNQSINSLNVVECDIPHPPPPKPNRTYLSDDLTESFETEIQKAFDNIKLSQFSTTTDNHEENGTENSSINTIVHHQLEPMEQVEMRNSIINHNDSKYGSKSFENSIANPCSSNDSSNLSKSSIIIQNNDYSNETYQQQSSLGNSNNQISLLSFNVNKNLDLEDKKRLENSDSILNSSIKNNNRPPLSNVPVPLKRTVESDEVRVMQKVLSNEINLTPHECAQILDSTDWDIHKAIKCVRLRQQLRNHNIVVDCDWAQMLIKFNWNIRQASNYLIATQGVPEDTTEV